MPTDSAQTIIFPFIDTTPIVQPIDTLKGFATVDFNLSNQTFDTACLRPSSSFFTPHALVPQHFGQQKPIVQLSPWISIVFIISLLFIALAKIVYGQRFTQILISPFSQKRFSQTEKDWASVVNPFKNLLLLNSVLMIGMFIMFFLDMASYVEFLPNGDIRLFGFIIVSIALFFLFKSLILNFIGILISNIQFSRQLLLYFGLILSLMGLVLFPLLAFAIYGKEDNRIIFLTVSAIILVLFYVFQIFRWTKVALSSRGAFGIYFFSYLCTVEFLLPLILIKSYLMF